MKPEYDAVVIGSGFGGGAVACRLAEAGWEVCVLERGGRFGRGDFLDRAEQAPRLFFHPKLNPDGLLDLRMMRDLAVLTAAGVGGGSLVYSNVQLRAPAEVFAEDWPDAIDAAALDPYYDRTEEALDPRLTPDHPPVPKIAAFEAATRAAGQESERLPIAVHFGEDRRHPMSGVAQQGCQNLGRCNIGCPVGARNTVDMTYIARAEEMGADVHSMCEAERLDPPGGAGGNWRIGFRDHRYRVKHAVEAPVVVLGAGTLGSTRLLLRNRRRLPQISAALGSRFSGNGDALGAAFDPTHEAVRGARTEFGPAMTSRVDYWKQGERFMLADGSLPENFTGLLEIVRGASALVGPGRLRLRLKQLASRLGFGDRPITPRDVRLASRPPITDSLVFLMIGQDQPNGQMRLTRLFRRLDIRWSEEDSRELFDRMDEASEELAKAAGARPFFALEGGPLGKFVTVHPLGGSPMSDDPALGVVDHAGRVHNYPGLYVADGSIVPTALGVNPSKTIAALAERIAELLAPGRPARGAGG